MHTYKTLREAIAAAEARQMAAQCATGRHQAECPHRRSASPWVSNALANTLPAKELRA